MSPRLNFFQEAPEAARKMFDLQKHLEGSGLDRALIELVRLRASQINGCAFCIDMHSKEAIKLGETHDRLHGLSAWRLFSLYTARERAALEWTEAVTLVSRDQVPDDVYLRTREHFTEKELATLTWVLVVINAWNRLSIGFRLEPGSL